MPFKVKDLMIDVAGAAQKLCITGTVRCCALYCTQLPTRITVCIPCTNHPRSWIACEAGTWDPRTITGCGISEDPTSPVYRTKVILEETTAIQAEVIPTLKEQLKAALELVEQREVALNTELQPKTIEEVTMLEQKLAEATEALKARRAELQKKPK